MSSEDTSLSNLRDLALPPEVSWWPLAPGWWILITLATLTGCALLIRALLLYRANAYRREALRELRSARDLPTVAALLRRTALAVYPREEVAPLTGNDWLNWLEEHGPESTPPAIRSQFVSCIYGSATVAENLPDFKQWAQRWIQFHRRPTPS
ncbi:MAG: DUF4381 domain-containing protein [Verrucomicrobiales bacterium]